MGHRKAYFILKPFSNIRAVQEQTPHIWISDYHQKVTRPGSQKDKDWVMEWKEKRGQKVANGKRAAPDLQRGAAAGAGHGCTWSHTSPSSETVAFPQQFGFHNSGHTKAVSSVLIFELCRPPAGRETCGGCWAWWAHPQRHRELCSRLKALPVRSTAHASAATGHVKGPGRAGCWKWLGFLWKMNWRHYCCLFWPPGFFAEGKKCIWNSKVTISKIIWMLSPSQMCPTMWFGRSLYPVCLFYILKFCRFVFTDSNVIVVIWTRCIVSSAPSAPANATTAWWARLIFEVKDDDISYLKWLSLSQLKCRAVLDGIRPQLEELLLKIPLDHYIYILLLLAKWAGPFMCREMSLHQAAPAVDGLPHRDVSHTCCAPVM